MVEIAKQELETKCKENAWVKRGGVMFEDDPFAEADFGYNFKKVETIDELRGCINPDYNVAIREGCILGDLAFVNQVNGGDEWWTLKKFPDGELVAFESVTFGPMIKRDELDGYIKRLQNATKEQCRKLDY